MKVWDKPTGINQDTDLSFQIDTTGWYLVTVSARVKGKKQRGKGVTDDEDLRIEIDGQRHWLPWNEATQAYNGGGNPNYEKEVYDAYKRGLDQRGKYPIKLWVVALLALVGVFSVGIFWMNGQRQQGDSGTVLSNVKQEIPVVSQSSVINAVKALMDESLRQYKTEKLDHYSEIFQEPSRFCEAHDQCYSDLIFPPYVPELVAGMQSNEQFAQAASSLGIIDGNNFYHGDIDNDSHAELVLALPDYLNHNYTTLIVIDQAQDRFQFYERKVELGYFNTPHSEIGYQSPLRVDDLTGDAVPEILLFLGRWRWGARLFVFSYAQDGIVELFNLDEPYVYPEFIFTDQNHNRILEIQVTGERFGLMPFNFECNACWHMEVEEVYEYNPKKGQFVQIKSNFFDVAGAFYYFLDEVRNQAFNHPILVDWNPAARDRFSYSLDQLQTQGVKSIFDTTDGKYVSGEGKTSLAVRLQRPLRLEDLPVREGETSEQTKSRLDYYEHSPVYEVNFEKQDDKWKVTIFQEVTPDRGTLTKSL